MSDGAILLEKAQAKQQELADAAEMRLKENIPAFWWAKKHHRNSRNEPMNFDDVHYLVYLYAAIKKNPRMVVEKSVQCGLSELFIVNSHVEAAAGMTVMYVLPKYELRNRFVNNRIYKLHRRVAHYSELLRQQNKSGIHRTSLMHFGEGTLAYVGSNVESEFIEMPVDSAYVDEKDRCNATNLLLLPDRYTASPYKFHREISNPTIEGFGIDERYLESSQGQWNIRCDSCGKWFVPDFFKNVVREIGPRQYEPRDQDADPDPLSAGSINLICECGAPVDRLKKGKYVHAYPNRSWKGYRISKIFNKYADLRELYAKWVKAQGNEMKIQVFWNSDLGLPYSSKGAKITEGDLNACKRGYSNPKPSQSTANPRLVGVDVGADLHYVVHDVVKEDGLECLRLLACGTVPTFELLEEEVLAAWKPRLTVIDALPEIHKVMELKSRQSRVWSSMFQDNQRKILEDKKSREIRMDRTAIMDYVKQYVDHQKILLPDNAEFLDNGQFYSHLQASTRILEANEENPEKSRFIWAHSMPDHFHLAEAYCVQAYMLLPNTSAFDFFKAHSVGVETPNVKDLDGVSEEKKQELERLARMKPEMILGGLQDRYAGKK